MVSENGQLSQKGMMTLLDHKSNEKHKHKQQN
jgi:hypothetical protein